MLSIDGAMGEGGGQILRSALAQKKTREPLSALYGLNLKYASNLFNQDDDEECGV